MIQLGSEVKDTITGFRGIVVGRCEWLHGCSRVIVEAPMPKDGKLHDPQWFDEQRVELLKEPSAKIMKTVKQTVVPPGGPMPDPKAVTWPGVEREARKLEAGGTFPKPGLMRSKVG